MKWNMNSFRILVQWNMFQVTKIEMSKKDYIAVSLFWDDDVIYVVCLS